MATEAQSLTVNTRRLGIVRFAATGALAATVFYVLCWIGALLPIGYVTHMYLQLFTSADISSGTALVQGAVMSAAFGLIAGGLIALFYNALAFLDRS
ncbi:MAG TPA: hypothetical protein VFO51_09550 [Sphingomicrobium sp.]|nr:hypothetical protein [Sphingomicrobium sp.]